MTRQYFFLWRLDDIDPHPVLVQHVLVEKLQAIAVNLDGAPGVAVHQRTEVVFELLLSERVGTLIEELGHASDRSGIGVDGLLGLALTTQCAKMLLVQAIEAFFAVLCSWDTSSVIVFRAWST